MRLIIIIAVGLLTLGRPMFAAADAAPAEETLAEGMVNPGFHEQPEWFKQSFLDIREDVDEASAAGRRVLLYFYQDGCPYCKKLLETNFALREIVDKTRNNFDVIAINIWGDREVTDLQGRPTTEKRFAEQLKVMFTPSLLFLDEQGRVVLRLNGYYPPEQFAAALDYVAGRHEKAQTMRAFFAARAPAKASGRLHREPGFLQPPYDFRTGRRERPLLVMFEQKVCPPCDELHQDILQRPESRKLLSRFDVALLDIRGQAALVTPSGERLGEAEWARRLKVQYVPTLVFFDTAGREVFRTEAYLKAFHLQSAMDYVASGAYLDQPNFQRFIQSRADALEAQGVHVDLMK
ncbi:thioredoxin fold domain-containing protein [Thiohalobacter sp. IOR34]|uniref:thioredoxin family protein n=1 Tax=Thiohalobacter sp. IOR34 TaxID=3057176 RepID=UPI0025B185A0|nr:thioredoxin fold domain-containing protein [Thiohalobacter sp. IOR34]WJW76653.1 thioredoxin fold domain-containing protein [Thiohalobacter sp. IOR34]